MASVGWKSLATGGTWVDALKAIFLVRGACISAGEVSRIGLQTEVAGEVRIIIL
jgi:hypothetical protein